MVLLLPFIVNLTAPGAAVIAFFLLLAGTGLSSIELVVFLRRFFAASPGIAIRILLSSLCVSAVSSSCFFLLPLPSTLLPSGSPLILGTGSPSELPSHFSLGLGSLTAEFFDRKIFRSSTSLILLPSLSGTSRDDDRRVTVDKTSN